MDKNALRAAMTQHGDTYEKLAQYLGISLQSVCAKINAKGSQFRQG